MVHTMLKVAIDNIWTINTGKILINNRWSLLNIIMRIIKMVIRTIIVDLLVLIPLLTPVPELF